MITQKDISVANRSHREEERARRTPAEKSNLNENPDLLFRRVTLGMILHERRKRRGRSIRRYLLLLLVVASLCGVWAYTLGDPRTFDWMGLWQRTPWPFDRAS